jgi:glyoxylase-like metal-dependent hydrolase (beta-lactamase superfamily II)
VRQVEALGYSQSDVRHLLLTYLDRDHAGGIPDFPNAKVHVHRREHDMAVTRRTPAMPLVLGMFQRRADTDRAMRIQNQERLRTLKADHGDAVTIFNSHDPVDHENCRCGRHQEVPAHARAG